MLLGNPASPQVPVGVDSGCGRGPWVRRSRSDWKLTAAVKESPAYHRKAETLVSVTSFDVKLSFKLQPLSLNLAPVGTSKAFLAQLCARQAQIYMRQFQETAKNRLRSL